MVFLWDENFIGNPNNSYYVRIAEVLGMNSDENWQKCKKMYQSFSPEVMEKFDRFIQEEESRKIWEDIKYLRELRNRPSKGIPIFTRFCGETTD